MQSMKGVVQRLEANYKGRDFYVGAVGDCVYHLDRLLEHVRFDLSSDRLITTGDLVGEIADSSGSLMVLGHACIHSVLGKHELALRGALEGGPFAEWTKLIFPHGEAEWVLDIDDYRFHDAEHYLPRLPLALEVEQADGSLIGVIHAELDARIGWAALSSLEPDDLIPSRSRFRKVVLDAITGADQQNILTILLGYRDLADVTDLWTHRRNFQRHAQRTRGVDLLIGGHTLTHNSQPFGVANRLYIETGGDRPAGKLTLVEPARGRYWQIGWDLITLGPSNRVSMGILPRPFSAFDVRESVWRRVRRRCFQ